MSIRPPKMWIATRLGRSSHVSSQGLETDWSLSTCFNFNENSAGWMIYISKHNLLLSQRCKGTYVLLPKTCFRSLTFFSSFFNTLLSKTCVWVIFFSFCLQIWCWSKSNVGLSSVLMKLASSCDIDAKIWHRLLMNS